MTNLYYFNNDCEESLQNRLFNYNQLLEVFNDVFKNELLEMGDNETTFNSWLNDNLKMNLIVEIDNSTITIPKQYAQKYVCCLPLEIENLIIEKVNNNYGYLPYEEIMDMLDNVSNEKITNITETINIEFK